MSDLLDRLQDMVDFKHDDMDVAREAIEEITRLRAELATARLVPPLNPDRWRGAINDALIKTGWLDPIREDEVPKDALDRLINFEVQVSLDQKTSERIEDMILAARREGLEQAAQAQKLSDMNVSTLDAKVWGDYAENHREYAAAIRAAAKEGKMSDVTLQDWPEGVKLRITYRHDKEGPRAITSYAGEWRFFEPVSVKIEPHPEGFYVPARDYDRQAAEIARLRAELATARREGMEEAAKRLEELHKNHKYDPLSGALIGKLGKYDRWPESAKTAMLEHQSGYYRALVEGAAHILVAAAKEGK